MQETLKKVEKEYTQANWPDFDSGDTIRVSMRIREGNKERVQMFQGTCIQRRGSGTGKTFTVRKSSGGVYIEKIFPLYSPLITDIKVLMRGKTRRAKLYYLRGRTGKATRIKEDK
ncbi:MAG: 50S ribosomal protein L19 [Chitinivibrionales bacterium]|nr:50S ribosomal protein L19 [Chitinivibrionales bacterium]